MKNLKLISTAIFTLLMFCSVSLNAQNFPDLDVSPMDAASYPSSYKVSEKMIKVIYSRPQLKGREISKLTPVDEVWRTGANEATQITFYRDVKFGNIDVKAGTYSLFTIPGAKEWTVILNSDVNVWGAYTYNLENDVATIKLPVTEGISSLEAFSIVFEDAKDENITMNLGWGTMRLAIPIMK